MKKAEKTKIVKRPDWDEYFMAIAELVGQRTTCLRRMVGAVAMREKRILTTGYNGAPAGLSHCLELGCLREKLNVPSAQRHELCRGIHAEQNCIIQAAYHGINLRGATMYVTNFPCVVCSKMIINAGFTRLVFDNPPAKPYVDELAEEMLKESKMELVDFSRNNKTGRGRRMKLYSTESAYDILEKAMKEKYGGERGIMKTNPYSHSFIAIEGIDGCGKSTLIGGLKKCDEENKIGAIFTKEPTDGEVGQKIRKILNNHGRDENGKKIYPEELQELYIYDRLKHRQTESVFLEGHPIFSDRDFFSTLAYGIAAGINFRWILERHEIILKSLFFVPNLVFILDLPAEEAIKRIKKAGKAEDYFEKLAFLEKVRQAYLELPKIMEEFYPDVEIDIQIIDASKPPEEVLEKALDVLAFYGSCGSCHSKDCQFRKSL